MSDSDSSSLVGRLIAAWPEAQWTDRQVVLYEEVFRRWLPKRSDACVEAVEQLLKKSSKRPSMAQVREEIAIALKRRPEADPIHDGPGEFEALPHWSTLNMAQRDAVCIASTQYPGFNVRAQATLDDLAAHRIQRGDALGKPWLK